MKKQNVHSIQDTIRNSVSPEAWRAPESKLFWLFVDQRVGFSRNNDWQLCRALRRGLK